MAITSLLAFIVAAAFFELILNISGFGASIFLPWATLVPLALIGGGAVLMFGKALSDRYNGAS